MVKDDHLCVIHALDEVQDFNTMMISNRSVLKCQLSVAVICILLFENSLCNWVVFVDVFCKEVFFKASAQL